MSFEPPNFAPQKIVHENLEKNPPKLTQPKYTAHFRRWLGQRARKRGHLQIRCRDDDKPGNSCKKRIWQKGKLPPSPKIFSAPLPKRRGRATSNVAVSFIPWAVAISGAKRGSSVSSLFSNLKQQCRDAQNPQSTQSPRNSSLLSSMMHNLGIPTLGVYIILSWDLATQNVHAAEQCEAKFLEKLIWSNCWNNR